MADGDQLMGSVKSICWNTATRTISQGETTLTIAEGIEGTRNAPKGCWLTVKGPIVTVSTERTPLAEPEPYCKLARVDPVCKDVDFDGSNSGVPEGQELQVVTANHKSEEPVSRMRSNDWGLKRGQGR